MMIQDILIKRSLFGSSLIIVKETNKPNSGTQNKYWTHNLSKNDERRM